MLRERLRDLRRQLVLRVHGSGSAVVGAAKRELVDQPIPQDWIDEGQPKARAAPSVKSADGTLQSGEWDCTAGRFHWTYFEDEVIHIVEGQAFIEVDGAMKSFGPGDAVFFPLGQTVRWHVPNYVRKVFFLRHPGKVVEALRSVKILGALAGSLLSDSMLSDPILLALS